MTENGVPRRRITEEGTSYHVTLEYLTIDPNLDYGGEGPSNNPDGLSEVERHIVSRFGEAIYVLPPRMGVRRLEWLTDGDFCGLTADEMAEFMRIIETNIPHFTISIQRDDIQKFEEPGAK